MSLPTLRPLMMDKGNDPPPNLREVFLDVNLFFWGKAQGLQVQGKEQLKKPPSFPHLKAGPKADL
jgi:hypothetical protein